MKSDLNLPRILGLKANMDPFPAGLLVSASWYSLHLPEMVLYEAAKHPLTSEQLLTHARNESSMGSRFRSVGVSAI